MPRPLSGTCALVTLLTCHLAMGVAHAQTNGTVKKQAGQPKKVATVSSKIPVATPAKIVFNQDIRPILSDKCFACHGPDKNRRQANLRLDEPNKTVVPGKIATSELIRRIRLPEGDGSHMPPVSFHKTLTEPQKQLIERWIAQGATYQKHWAYEPPVKAKVPADENPVDYLVRQRLAQIGLQPSPRADRRTLIRRLSIDLLGLPPTPAEVESFVKDDNPHAYVNLVERLLANPHYGERMAQGWLDVVRFADTIGYHSDNPRNIWPYRDWVINAFNSNKRFDRFTIEQIAGDLLPDANQETRVGSAFNRLLLTTEEGGAQAKDYEARYLTDRVRSIGTVWLGQTTGCAQCHDHKFDPITTRDFYSLGAFFADIDEAIIGGREPGMQVLNSEQRLELERLQASVDSLQRRLDGPHPELASAQAAWEAHVRDANRAQNAWVAPKPTSAQATNGALLTVGSDKSILATGANPSSSTYTIEFATKEFATKEFATKEFATKEFATKEFATKDLATKDLAIAGPLVGVRVEVLPDPSLPANGPGRAGNGNFVLTEVEAELLKPGAPARKLTFREAQASFEQMIIGEANPYRRWNAASTIDGDVKGEQWGWAILPEVGKPQSLLLTLSAPVAIGEAETLRIVLKQNHGTNHTLGKFRISVTGNTTALRSPAPLPADILTILMAEQRTPEQSVKLANYYKGIAPELVPLRAELDIARVVRDNFDRALPRCIVSVRRATPRTVRILPRGNFLDESGDLVKPATPAFLPNQTGGSRLDLANWLVSRQNPLTARAVMNRLWKQFFGTGLAKVMEDLGAQGEPPLNGPLLDWLACEFMDSGWDIKHMVSLMVNSATYKQASTASKALMAKDPYNREFARQSRFRLEAEEVRDNALAVSGLLSLKIGGPSVKPYQPDRYWENLNFPVRDYIADKGESQYRRGLYTWWQRSFLHPSLLAFDAPSREECAADRVRSNIPQQALVLLNDPTYVEAARAFGLRIMKEAEGTPQQRIVWAWRQALQRDPTPAEAKTLLAVYEKQRDGYTSDPSSADMLFKVGFTPIPEGCDRVQLAAWSHVARVLLNLHETITRP